MKYVLFFISLVTLFACSTEKELNNRYVGKHINEVKLPTKQLPKIIDSLGFKVYCYKYQQPKMETNNTDYNDLIDVEQYYIVDTSNNRIKKVRYLETLSKILCYKRVEIDANRITANRTFNPMNRKVIRAFDLKVDSIKNRN